MHSQKEEGGTQQQIGSQHQAPAEKEEGGNAVTPRNKACDHLFPGPDAATVDTSAMDYEYDNAIARGVRLYKQQKEMVWSTTGPAPDMRATYVVATGKVAEPQIQNIGPVLRSENVTTDKLMWVQVESRRVGHRDGTMCLTRLDANSGVLIVVDIDKSRDGNLPVNQLRPSELMWQGFT
ncbi:hypothetical protein Daus18300_013385 [Diaporthe australafricana]|uniref:Uncharacterized protein n=1 Tax=Diaporthe australafricana TaxID=127596 RepID=A0ABR3VZB8_9PEZI